MHLASHAWVERVICPFVPRGVAPALELLRVDGAPTCSVMDRTKKGAIEL